MRFIFYCFYILLQCSWGFLQTLGGLMLFLRYLHKPHSFYNGSIKTHWDSPGGISLGLFIFVPAVDALSPEHLSRITVHEYGHTYQSLLLGPLYLFVIGIPSIVWASTKRYQNLRKQYGVPYSFYWTESWADALGEKVTGQPALR